MFERTLVLPDAAATAALGARIGRALRAGDLVFLMGDLGAGKTTLARGAIAALTGERAAPSPTYNLVQTYPGPNFDIWHFDLYRLNRPEEAYELGLEEALQEAACLVEWPERLQGLGSAPGLAVLLAADGEGRIARLSAGPAWETRLGAL